MRPPQLTSRQRKTYRDDHGTPDWILDLTRRIHGSIVLDLASTAADNKRVKAERFYSPRNPCPMMVAPGGLRHIYCNPPGPCAKALDFWDLWCAAVKNDAEGSFLFFSADHMRKASPPPIKLWVMIPHKRLKFHGAKAGCSWVSALVSTKPPRLATDWLLGHWLTWEPHR